MRVEPIPEDVAWAETQSRWACVVVRAIQRQIPTSTYVRVDKETIAYSDKGHRYYHVTPPEMVEDIIKPFDENHHEDIKLGSYPLIVARTAEVRKLTPEKKQVLRTHTRNRQRKEREKVIDRKHDRFCPVPDET